MVLPVQQPGSVGEMIVSSINAAGQVAVLNATAKDVTSILLGPGEWLVYGDLVFVGTGTTIIAQNPLRAGISQATGTMPATFDLEASESIVITTTGFTLSIPLPLTRFNLAANTTLFMEAFATFSAGSMNAYGRIEARRMR